MIGLLRDAKTLANRFRRGKALGEPMATAERHRGCSGSGEEERPRDAYTRDRRPVRVASLRGRGKR